jgi:hypothetical protein
MTEATPRLRSFARRLIVHGAQDSKPVETNAPSAVPVREKLPRQLEVLIGKAGVQALLSRAHALAIVELPWLRSMHINGDGSLEAESTLRSQLLPEQLFEGQEVLLAHFLGLLEAFIGVALTMRLVREVYPDLQLDELDPGEGVANEQAE